MTPATVAEALQFANGIAPVAFDLVSGPFGRLDE